MISTNSICISGKLSGRQQPLGCDEYSHRHHCMILYSTTQGFSLCCARRPSQGNETNPLEDEGLYDP